MNSIETIEARLAERVSSLIGLEVTETPPEQRGTALALYSSIGFAGGFIGPVAFGAALDAFGRNTHAGWAAGFVTLACGVGCGRWAIGRIESQGSGIGRQ